MRLEFPRSIGDGYPEYVEDELGYNYHASEVISASEANRHEQIQVASGDELDDLESRLGTLSDLERWTLARRRLENGDIDDYIDHVESIVDGPLEHPALHYPEIFVDLARRYAETGDVERGLQTAARIEEAWPELADAIPLVKAQLLLAGGRHDEADDAFHDALEPHDDAVDLYIETAEDFRQAGVHARARDWLDRARQLADELGDQASIVDIELLEQKLPATDDAPSPTDSDEPGLETDSDGPGAGDADSTDSRRSPGPS